MVRGELSRSDEVMRKPCHAIPGTGNFRRLLRNLRRESEVEIMASDRFTTWTNKSEGDRSETLCRDNETGKSEYFADNQRGRQLMDAWKREQERKTKARAA